MGAIRKANTHYPQRLFAKNGGFWYVSRIDGKQVWYSLGRSEKDAIRQAVGLNAMKAADRQRVMAAVHRIDQQVRDEVLSRDRFKCVYCGTKKNLGVNHVIPISAGGATAPFNLAACCYECNRSKGDRDPREFAFSLVGVRSALIDRAIDLLDKRLIS